MGWQPLLYVWIQHATTTAFLLDAHFKGHLPRLYAKTFNPLMFKPIRWPSNAVLEDSGRFR